MRGPPLLALLLLGLATPSRASAEPRRIVLRVDGDCPAGELMRVELLPLMQRAKGAGPPAHARVRDDGARYVVEIEGARRAIDDPGRDCVARARVASVFIALNAPEELPSRTVQREAPTPPEPATPPPPPAPRAPAAPARDQLELRVLGAVATAPAAGVTAPGVLLGAALVRRRLQGRLDFGVLAPVELGSSSASPATAALQRFPAVLALGPRWTARSLELDPSVGLAADVLRVRGREVVEPRTSTRGSVGLDLALALRVRTSQSLRTRLELGASWFPRAYELRVVPDESLDPTPRLWLNVRLGIGVLP